MTRIAALVTAAVLLAACPAPDDQDGQDGLDTPDTAVTPPLPPPTTPEITAFACAQQPDNVLRYDCAVTTSAPAGSVRVGLAERGGPVRSTFTAEPVDGTDGAAHTVTLWGMRADRDHDVTASTGDGAVATASFRTAPLPALVQQLHVDVTGIDPVTDTLMVPFRCDEVPFLGIIDVTGALVWYQELIVDGDGTIGMFNPTDDGGVVAIVAHDVQEWDLRGQLRRQLVEGIDFDNRIHHDVIKRDGLLYALFADVYPVGSQEAVVDGIYVFDDTAIVDTWELYDHVVITEADLAGGDHLFWQDVFPGAVDFSHANSLFVDDGGIYVSTRWLSTVWKLRPHADPAFGDVVWRLVGRPQSPILPDFRLTADVPGPAGFVEQHHARIDPAGRLTLFDNRLGVSPTSRIIAYALDPTGIDAAPGTAAGAATVVEAHDLGQMCDTQGSVYTTPAGDRVATCAPTGEVLEYRADGGDTPAYTMKVQCADDAGLRVIMPRAVPIDLVAP